MAKQIRGDDASDHAPRPVPKDANQADKPADKQDAANYDSLKDSGRAIPLGEINSANDE